MLEVQENTLIRDLGDDLILRRSNPADAEKIFEFNAFIHGEDGPDDRIGQWARDLLEKPHPTFAPNDFTIVEQKSTGRIVSSLNLIPQTWSYEGIPFKVGRPELVGTLPEFRNRGLVRLQMEEVHRWSTAQGQLVQAITGIPNYYRMFGYEMCVDLDGSRSGFEMNLPRLAEDAIEPYRLRPATETDIPFISAVYQHAGRRSLLQAERDQAMWRLEINGRSEKSIARQIWNIIERCSDGEAVGILAHPWFAGEVTCPAQVYELKPGISWAAVTPSVVRWLWNLGESVCTRDGKTCSAFTFALGGDHPVYDVLRDSLPRVRRPYSWYMRVPDLAGFIRHITPALEMRLANSLIPGHTGGVRLNFYRSGLRLSFEYGKLAAVDSWQPDPKNEGDISFPNQVFLQVLFGHRGLDEIRQAYADCWWERDETRLLVSSLFPRKPSQVLGIS
jgi:hypothetical protein